MFQHKIYTNQGSREINEDSAGVAFENGEYCFVVADGLGGHGNGEIASQIAMESVCSAFVEKGYSDTFFDDAFTLAQERILQEQNVRLAPSKMKTTIVSLVIQDDRAYWAHIGDSRLYVFKNNKLKTRTIDHSVPQMLALSGNIKESDIRFHPDRNRLMRVMGINGEIPKYEKSSALKLSGNQAFLICTDGYWELIEEEQMEKFLKTSETPDEWIEKMNEEIRKNGQNKDMDNYTAIAIFSKKGRWFW